MALLADRFKLVIHRETKDLPVYSFGNCQERAKIPGSQTSAGRMTALMVSMADLAQILSGILGRRVLNRTAIEGKFDLKLDWTPDSYRMAPDNPEARPQSDGPAPNAEGLTLFVALQEQLGLKLEAARASSRLW